MKTTEHLTIEFRYQDKKPDKDSSNYCSTTITVGVYDTLDEAIKKGNKLLNAFELSGRFDLAGERFKKNHLFGYPKRLVINRRSKGVEVYCKITQLKFGNVQHAMNEAFKANSRYKDYKFNQNRD